MLCEDLDLEDLKYQEKNSREETKSYSKDRETHSLEHTSKYYLLISTMEKLMIIMLFFFAQDFGKKDNLYISICFRLRKL